MKDNKFFHFSLEELHSIVQKDANPKEIAFRLAEFCHKGQVDRGNVPYIEHLKAVCDIALKNSQSLPISIQEKIACVSYLHDILEDTNCPLSFLQQHFENDIVKAVDLLTKKGKGSAFEKEEYFAPIKANQLARIVKIADLIHNSSLVRLQEVKRKDIARSQKYLARLLYLMEE